MLRPTPAPMEPSGWTHLSWVEVELSGPVRVLDQKLRPGRRPEFELAPGRYQIQFRARSREDEIASDLERGFELDPQSPPPESHYIQISPASTGEDTLGRDIGIGIANAASWPSPPVDSGRAVIDAGEGFYSLTTVDSQPSDFPFVNAEPLMVIAASDGAAATTLASSPTVQVDVELRSLPVESNQAAGWEAYAEGVITLAGRAVLGGWDFDPGRVPLALNTVAGRYTVQVFARPLPEDFDVDDGPTEEHWVVISPSG
ncbi:MAG: hypothetical protein QM572_14425 [Nocardioides sp.]|uniref:hypothetical protein n=1 Tax=Nocardioides sp. TaxID=35761 RepID=UPI0039E5A45D